MPAGPAAAAVLLLAALAAARAWMVAAVPAAVLALGASRSKGLRRRNERAVDDLVASSGIGVFSVDRNGRVRLWNAAMESMTGRPPRASVGRELDDVLQLRDELGAPVGDLLSGPAEAPSDGRRLVRLGAGPGDERWLVLGRAALHEGGFAFVAQDVTGQRQAEEAVHENEGRLSLALEAGRVGWWRWDFSSGEVYISDTYERHLGFPPGGFGGSLEELVERLHPDDRARLGAAIDRTLADGSSELVYRTVGRDGTLRWIEGKALVVRGADGRPAAMTGVAVDVTERREAEERLREAEERYRTLVEELPLAMYIDALDDVSSNMYTSPQVERMLGYSQEEWLSDAELFSKILHPDDRERVLAESARADAAGEPFHSEYRVVARDGRVLWVQDEAVIVRDAEGRPLYAQGYMLDLTERKATEEALREAEAKYRSLVEELPLATYIDALDATSSNIYTSPATEELLGYSREEWRSDPGLFPRILHPEDRERVLAEHSRTHETGEPLSTEYRAVANDGRIVWIRDEAVVVRDAQGNRAFLQGYMLDLTERKLAEEELRESEERFRALFENATDMVCSLDEQGRFTSINRAGETITGYAGDELLGMSFEALLAPGEVPRARGRFEQTMYGSEVEAEELEIVRKDGSRATLDVSYSRVETRSGRRVQVIARDVSERKRLEQELRRRALYDSLTGLANRVLFRDRVTHALARRQHSAAVLFLDLDDFKHVNDSLGHPAGDRLLEEVAERLRSCTRPADTCARLGGDEFALLLEDVREPGHALETARRVLEALAAPFALGGAEVVVRASIGVALSGSSSEGPDRLLRNADVAMYAVKARGKSAYALFEPAMLETTQTRLELVGALRRAIERHELRLHYQPIVELGTGAITGVEALVRWHHPSRGLLSPAEFVPLAEETGLIVPLGRWALAEACRQARRWQDAYSCDPPLGVGVNISARHLRAGRILADVEDALTESGLAPRSLVLELTESVLADEEDAGATLRRLGELGVRLALDDFGTGYSSLAYLHRLPIDILKIDRSFVRAMTDGATEQRMVSMILSLGESLGLDVVAEGVELPEERDRLYALGCRRCQGFLFALPRTAEETEPLLAARVVETGKLRLRVAAGGGRSP